jgi:hypothetical protein
MKTMPASIRGEIILLALGFLVAFYALKSSVSNKEQLQVRFQNTVIENGLYAKK